MKKNKIQKIIIIFILLLINIHIFSLDSIIFDDNKNSYSVGRYFEYYEDTSNNLTITDILKPEVSSQFIKNNKDLLSLGYTKSSIWLRFKLKNNSITNHDYILEVLYPFINNLEFYFLNDKGNYSIKKNGLDIPFNKREIKNKKLIFNIKVDYQKESEIYLKIKNNYNNIIKFYIYEEKYFHNTDGNENFLLGFYYGIMFIILIINILIYLFIREKSYLYYILFFLFVIFVQMFFNRIITEIFPDSNWYGKIVLFPFTNMALFFLILFVNNSFNTKKNFPVLHVILFLFKFFIIINFMLSFMSNKQLIMYLSGMFILLTISIVIVIGLKSYLRRIRAAIYFLIAWGFYFIGVLLATLTGIGLIPFNFISFNSMQIASIFLVIFIPIVQLDKYNIIKKEKEDAEKTITEKEKEKFASIGMLLGGISHEIYNPLSGITGPLDNLRKNINTAKKPDKEMINKYINYIEKNTRRIENIIKNVRALYKKEKFAKEKLNVNEIIKSVIENYENNPGNKIDFELKIDKKKEIIGDWNALYQVLNNLVSNAVDSINKTDKIGKIIITLEKENGKKIIQIIDNGSGIMAKDIDKIFNAFYTTKKIGNNTGLGLYIVKDLIIKLGWEIKVSSEEDKGTIFSIIVKE